MNEESSTGKWKKQSPAWAVSLSILVGVGWVVFLLLWLFFFGYPRDLWEKNVAIILLSLVILCGVLGGPWGYWAIKNQSTHDKELWAVKGFKSRLAFSIILGAVVFLFLIYWFWFQAVPYSVFQNIVIFIIAFLIGGGIIAALWAPWGMRNTADHHYDD